MQSKMPCHPGQTSTCTHTMQFVFTIQNECIQCIRCKFNQNQSKMYSFKNVFNQKCNQKCRATWAKHPHARINNESDSKMYSKMYSIKIIVIKIKCIQCKSIKIVLYSK